MRHWLHLVMLHSIWKRSGYQYTKLLLDRMPTKRQSKTFNEYSRSNKETVRYFLSSYSVELNHSELSDFARCLCFKKAITTSTRPQM